MSWTYRFARRVDSETCEECCGKIRERTLLVRLLVDGQRLVREPVHMSCASSVEMRVARRYAENVKEPDRG